jgi:hypothetical protein
MLKSTRHRAVGRFCAGFWGIWIAIQTPLMVVDAADDATFREFPDSEVATPAELLRTLDVFRDLRDSYSRAASTDPENPSRNNPNREVNDPTEEEDPNGSNSPRRNSTSPNRLTFPMNENDPGARRTPATPPPNRTGQSPRVVAPPRPGSTPPVDPRRVSPPNVPQGNSPGPGQAREPRRAPSAPPQTQDSDNPRPNRITISLPPELPKPKFPEGLTERNSSERETPPPRGSFRDRLNRILLGAAQDSFEKRTNEAASLSMFEKAFSKATSSMKDSLDGRAPGWRKRIANRWDSAREGARHSRDESSGWLRRSTPSMSGAGNSSNATAWLLVALGLLVIAAIAFFSRRRIGKYFATQPQMTLKRLRFALRSIDSRGDLILAVDRFLLWSLGTKSGSWNCQVMKMSLATNYPQLGPAIEYLVSDYEQARYAPDSCEISSTQFKRCMTTLHHLVAAETAKDD